MKQQIKEHFYFPLDRMPVQRGATPALNSPVPPGTYLYSWVKRGTVRVKCLAHVPRQNLNRKAQSVTTNNEATVPSASPRGEGLHSAMSLLSGNY